MPSNSAVSVFSRSLVFCLLRPRSAGRWVCPTSNSFVTHFLQLVFEIFGVYLYLVFEIIVEIFVGIFFNALVLVSVLGDSFSSRCDLEASDVSEHAHRGSSRIRGNS